MAFKALKELLVIAKKLLLYRLMSILTNMFIFERHSDSMAAGGQFSLNLVRQALGKQKSPTKSFNSNQAQAEKT